MEAAAGSKINPSLGHIPALSAKVTLATNDTQPSVNSLSPMRSH